ncbi:MAG: dipeptide epimerase [bacterium]|jgi:L-alanine-DL-glutamate epimerase-like enolase superfamily enzyme|nr:dipeptide epimerase [bacterium]
MKITNVETWQVDLKLQEPYTIAYETYDRVINIFLRIETDSGIIGYGCAAPDEHVTGETEHSVLAALNDVAIPILTGADPLRFVLLLEELKKRISHQYAALAAVDMALFDILGKHSNLPLWKLFGGFRDRIQTSITIGILPAKETIERAKDWIAQGFNCLKLKGGNDVESDIMRVIKVREAVGAEVEIRFDANQGYSLDQARYFIEKTKQAKLQFIEQPTARHLPDTLHDLTTNSSLPVMADEIMITLQDALQLGQNKSVNMLNVKLMKVGGITEAAQIDSVARAAGLEVMVGCMDESTLSIAAGLHFALARPNVCYADLDGYIGLLNDPFTGAVSLMDGVLFPTDLPGLGYQSLP